MKMKQSVYFYGGVGSLIQNNWDGVQFAFPFIIISFLVLLFMSRKLNILLLGDDVAISLGEKTAVTRLIAFIAAIFFNSSNCYCCWTNWLCRLSCTSFNAPYRIPSTLYSSSLFFLMGGSIIAWSRCCR